MRSKMSGLLGLVLVATLLSGCSSTHKMALEANKGSLPKLSKPIGIFTLRTENAYKPSYPLQVNRIIFASSGSQEKAPFAPNKPYKQEKSKYLEYLVSVDLSSGDYSLLQVQGKGSGFLISGGFFGSVNARFNLTNGITYLGHVTMINRQRQEGEERAGPLFPLLDQSVCGFSGGTIDTTVIDRSETDIPDFVRAYPPLKDVQITKSLMQK